MEQQISYGLMALGAIAVLLALIVLGLRDLNRVRELRRRENRVAEVIPIRRGIYDHEQHPDGWPQDEDLIDVLRGVFEQTDPPPRPDITELAEAARRRHPSGGRR